MGVTSPSSLNTGFGSVKAAEARAFGNVSTELKSNCSISLLLQQRYGAIYAVEKTLISRGNRKMECNKNY